MMDSAKMNAAKTSVTKPTSEGREGSSRIAGDLRKARKINKLNNICFGLDLPSPEGGLVEGRFTIRSVPFYRAGSFWQAILAIYHKTFFLTSKFVFSIVSMINWGKCVFLGACVSACGVIGVHRMRPAVSFAAHLLSPGVRQRPSRFFFRRMWPFVSWRLRLSFRLGNTISALRRGQKILFVFLSSPWAFFPAPLVFVFGLALDPAAIGAFPMGGAAAHRERIDPTAFPTELLATVPVLHEGRVKPLDTFARVHLLAFSGKSSIKGMSQMDWLCELLFLQEQAYNRPVFKIRNPDVQSEFHLEKKEGNLYSFREVSAGLQKAISQVEELMRIPAKERSPSQKRIVGLYHQIMRYYEISRSLSLILPDFEVRTARLAKLIGIPQGRRFTYMEIFDKQRELDKVANAILHIDPKNFTNFDYDVLALGQQLRFMDSDNRSQVFRIIPPQWQEDGELWFSPWELVMRGRGSAESARYFRAWQDVAVAFRKGDVEGFGKKAQALSSFAHEITGNRTNQPRLLVEYFYNKLDAFLWSLSAYIGAFLFLMVSWIYKPRLFEKISFYALGIGVLFHFTGICLRMYIMARPPVSTLYESILFVGFIAAASGLYLEKLKGMGLGLLLGSIVGAALQFVGFGYASNGDSMGMLVAVLNTNFWLATHVVTITTGYGACYVGGFVAHVYLIKRILNPSNKKEQDEIIKTLLGITLVALFFAMFGTILGGIWADQSWGRFWGWDPKENGALLICLWLLALLHGRLAGYLKNLGFALGMVATNIVVALAWFGVNLLNIGLHSYGFTDSIAWNLALFCGAELLFLLVAWLLIEFQLVRRET